MFALDFLIINLNNKMNELRRRKSTELITNMKYYHNR